MDLDKEVSFIQRQYDYLRKRRTINNSSNFDHVIRNSLNILINRELIQTPIKELEELVSNIKTYFDLIRDNEEFAQKEINGPGYFKCEDHELYLKQIKEFSKDL
jgi:hypothetical protein